MVKGKFLITAEKEGVITAKGVRAFVMERILNSPLQKGIAVNIDEKTVEIQLEGDREKIGEFIKALKKELIENFGNPVIKLSDFKEDQSIEIPEIIRSSQALTIGQLQKGIGVQLEILSTLKELSSGMKGLSDGMKDLSQGMKGLSDDSKSLPERLAEKLLKSQF